MIAGVLTTLEPPVLVRESAFDRIRQAIISGQIPPGTRLVERELCEALGISRASVREVIRRLEAERLIDVAPRRAPTVARLTSKQAREIYEIRSIFESLLARRFTEMATDEEVAGLRAIFDKVTEAAAGNRIYDLVFLMFNFNSHMVKVVDHEVIADLLNQLNARVSWLRATSMSKPGRIAASLEEIAAIVDAVEKRNPDEAARWTAIYVGNARNAALEKLEEMENDLLATKPGRGTRRTT